VVEMVRPRWKRRAGGSLGGIALRGAVAAASLNVVKRRACVMGDIAASQEADVAGWAGWRCEPRAGAWHAELHAAARVAAKGPDETA
jgi:tRNA(Arg) A34 adenosine deaminase TadA